MIIVLHKENTTYPLAFLSGLCQYIDMVCIYCGSPLQVTNTRPQKRRNQIWRRRHCNFCKNTFTTHEEIRLEPSIRVRDRNGKLTPFSRIKLLISLHKSLTHVQSPSEAAEELSYTVSHIIIKNCLESATIDYKDIVYEATQVLKRFDTVAGLHYEAQHKN